MKSLNESLRNNLLLEARPDEATIERVADLAEEIKANKDLIKAGYIVTNSGTRKGRQKPALYGRDGWLLGLDLEKEDGSNITYNDVDIIAKILGLNDIKTKTLISDLKNNLIKSGAKNIIVTNSNGKVQSNNTKLATGQKITIVSAIDTKTYTIVVRGDSSGDGDVTILDLLQIRKHLKNDKKLSGAYFYAADTSGDNNITILDLLQVQKHLKGDKQL